MASPLLPLLTWAMAIIDVPTRVAINSTLPEYVRGYVQSWNLTLEKELLWGFTGQVGYVGTRQIKQLGFLDLNAGRVGGGNASKPFNQKFGRNVLTRAIGPIGNSIYDSMQAWFAEAFFKRIPAPGQLHLV